MSATWYARRATILGEDMRLVLLSVTEGEDKPLKYPSIFNTADIAVITKIDLADAVEFDLEAATENILAVRPGMRILPVSAKSGEGMEPLPQLLAQYRSRKCCAPSPGEQTSSG